MELKADSLHLQLLKLAKEGNGLIAPSAFISFSCRPVEPLSPVAFTSEESHVVSIFFYKIVSNYISLVSALQKKTCLKSKSNYALFLTFFLLGFLFSLENKIFFDMLKSNFVL